MGRKRKKKTADVLLRHARRRARERYGLDLQDHEVRGLANRIKRGAARFIAKQSNTKSIFEIDAFGKTLPVVYNKAKGVIATFLPRDYIWYEHFGDGFGEYCELEITMPGPVLEERTP
jgi:hypothetical protein